jgi:hypothetical protein
MRIRNSIVVSTLAFVVLLTAASVLAVPITAADPLIEYHALPDTTPETTEHYNHETTGAWIRSPAFGLDKSPPVSEAEVDWEKLTQAAEAPAG